MKDLFLKVSFAVLLAANVLLLSACSKKADELSHADIVNDTVTRLDGIVLPDAPDAAVQTIISEFANGNSAIIWQAMPASYQNDVNGLMHIAGSKLNKKAYEKAFSLFARFAEVIQQQQPFIVNSSFLQNQPAEPESDSRALQSLGCFRRVRSG